MKQPYKGSERRLTARREVHEVSGHKSQVDVDAFADKPLSRDFRPGR
ncbi:MAG: hypothetical protein K2M56_01035 [Muribaculaceae bacterium]|nr:hypothetical protein [Muribaculaceae bacterium]